MNLLEYFRIAYVNLRNRQFRAYLTMIGVLIGITAVITVVSLGWGLQAAINEQFEALGTDKVIISPGTSAFTSASSAAKLTDKDVKTIMGVAGTDKILSFAYKSAKIEFKGEENFVIVMAVSLDEGEELWFDMWGDYFMEGRMIERGDTTKAYMGYEYTAREKVFSKSMQLFDKITINGVDFQVVGFQETIGNSADDQTVYITEDAYERVFGEQLDDDIKSMIVRVKTGQDPSLVAEEIKRKLRDARNVDVGEEDFTIQTPEQFQESFNTIFSIVLVAIFGIAAISLFVGGIGIMNTMYTAVVERTQEIGIMKAIGARNSDVLAIFLIESGMLGLIGGLIGIIIGLALAKAVEIIGAAWLGTPYLKAWWSWGMIFGALAFSFITGAGSGLAPAYQASKKKPVESLRYE